MMDKLTIDDIPAIEAEAERATPGPWKIQDGNVVYDTFDSQKCVQVLSPYDEYYSPGWGRDAAFIAHSRANVPALCALARSQQAEIERLKAEFEKQIVVGTKYKWQYPPVIADVVQKFIDHARRALEGGTP